MTSIPCVHLKSLPVYGKVSCRHATCHSSHLLPAKAPQKLVFKQYQILVCLSTRESESSTSTSALTSCINLPSTLSPGDLLRTTLPNDKDLYFEITKCRPINNMNGEGSSSSFVIIEAVCEGEVIRISQPNGTIEHLGHWPRLSDSWVKQYPTLQTALKSLRQHQENSNTLPSSLLNSALEAPGGVGSAAEKIEGQISLEKVTSLNEFEAEIASNPSFWCDGTAPEDPTPTSEQTALLSAGELSSFLQGLRGVLLVQLELAVTPDVQVPLPLLRPFVLRLLQQALDAKKKGIVVLPSTAPGGGAASLVLAAKQQPFKAWGARLAQIGVQAALVADSPYYKLLVGKILGYKDANIVHHIETYGQKLEQRVAAAVEEELSGLSGAPPRLPWTSSRK